MSFSWAKAGDTGVLWVVAVAMSPTVSPSGQLGGSELSNGSRATLVVLVALVARVALVALVVAVAAVGVV